MTASRHDAADGRPLLILVSPMAELTRGYMLKSVARQYRLWLFMEGAPSWESEFICGHTAVDTLDADEMIRAARDVPASGILCWDETRILPAALLAEAYRLPTMPSGVVRTCRDKFATRRALDRSGVSPVAAAAAGSLAEALAAADTIGYPVVLKPRALVGSNGTTMVRDPAELSGAYDSVATRSMPEVRERFKEAVLIERYLDGPEISVDSLCWDGAVTPLFIARKDLGFPPYFEETGHTVSSRDPLLRDDELGHALTAAHASVGLTRGWTHTEWRLTTDGPRLVEINARSGGDLIPYLGLCVTGIDAGRAAALLALGRPPLAYARLRAGSEGAAAVRFLYPNEDTVVGGVQVREDLLPPAVDQVQILARPGQRLSLPPAAHVTGRYALVVVCAATAEQCQAALNEAAKAITLVPAGPCGRLPGRTRAEADAR